MSDEELIYLRSAMVPQIVDMLVAATLEKRPRGVRAVLEVIHTALEQSRKPLIDRSCARMHTAIQSLTGGGFPDDEQITFSVPRDDGEEVELFPHGADVVVNPVNYRPFLQLLEARATQAPISQIYRLAPIAPELNLIGDYAPLIRLLEESVHPGGLSKEDWECHGVKYHVPFRGTLHELFEGGSNTPVPYTEVMRFCCLCREKLAELKSSRVLRRPKKMCQTVTALDHQMVVVENDNATKTLFSPSHFDNNIFAPFQTIDSLQAKPSGAAEPPKNECRQPSAAARAAMAVAAAHNGEAGAHEEATANYVYDIRAFSEMLDSIELINTENGERFTEEDFAALDVRYWVPLGGKIIDLFPDGHKQKVRLEDAKKYVKLAREKLGLAPRNPSEKRTPKKALKTPPPSGDPGPFSPSHFQYDLFAPFISEREFAQAVATERPISAAEADHHLRQLLSSLEVGQWNAADIERLNLTFTIPENGKIVELFDGGAKESVTAARKDEFVLLAKQRLLPAAGEVSRSLPAPEPSKQLFSPSHFEHDIFSPFNTVENVAPMQAPQVLVARRVSLPNSSEPYAPKLRPAVSKEETEFWHMIDALAATEDLTDEEVRGMDMTFLLRLSNGRLVELVADGASRRLTVRNVEEFVSLVRQKRDLIHLAFEEAPSASMSASTLKKRSDLAAQALPSDEKLLQPCNPITPRGQTLSVQTLDTPFFAMVEGMEHLNGTAYDANDFTTMGMRWVIPNPDGTQYLLKPNGNNLPVSIADLPEYSRMVKAERGRLELLRQRLLAHRNMAPLPITFDKQLSPNDTTTLVELRRHIQELEKVDLASGWERLPLAWCLRFGEETVDLVEHGRFNMVSFAERKSFVSVALKAIDTILSRQKSSVH